MFNNFFLYNIVYMHNAFFFILHVAGNIFPVVDHTFVLILTICYIINVYNISVPWLLVHENKDIYIRHIKST